ncbi:hypothetical protein N0M98_24280 [Paenibacillus doosanensis]|uniref:DUF4025 domain-containing protein n=1 Tax=Paenibacillus konkukensis TaxID=2020716 RepID=A0ABY4RRR9_9BACL|nr:MULTISPECIES: hypothetical protein [Paenibacillus]MCS7463245.1 hypothetical protein [Paenibacillus doosanensis]UQZ85221.1 hypothetical protein SK3146_04504 [Paenibacillus konkukensis]
MDNNNSQNGKSAGARNETANETTEAAGLTNDTTHQGREDYFMDIDRMVNEGLGGGYVSANNGHIGESTTDTMDHPESVLNESTHD